MSETKPQQFRPPLYHQDSSSVQPAANSAQTHSDKKGWDAYRKWLATVSRKPLGERTPIDHSIYSWKGYHNWADRVRQNWKNEEE